MPRVYIYIGHILLTSGALLGVKMFCSWNLYYYERPMLLTIAGMNVLLGMIVLRKLALRERLLACGLVTAILLGVFLIYHSSLLRETFDLSEISFEFPTMIFFAATVGYWELTLELKKRKVF